MGCCRSREPRPEPIGCDNPIYEMIAPIVPPRTPIVPPGAPLLPRRLPLPVPNPVREASSDTEDEIVLPSPMPILNRTSEMLENMAANRIKNPAYQQFVVTKDAFNVQFAFVVIYIAERNGGLEMRDGHEEVQGYCSTKKHE